MPGLPLGVRPVRERSNVGLALPQFLVVAEHLDGQQGMASASQQISIHRDPRR